MAKKYGLSHLKGYRISEQVKQIESEALKGTWRTQVQIFDAEQDRKLKIEQTNKAIKDRRGIK